MVQKKEKVLKNIKDQVNKKQEWLSVILSFITLEVAILSIERAKWLNPQPSLSFVLVLAVLAGAFIAKRNFRRLFKWLIVIAGGVLVTSWQTLILLPESTASWTEKLADTFGSVFSVFTGSQAAEGSIHFAIFLVIFTWLLGTLATWALINKKNPWMVAVPGLIVVLITLSNLPDRFFGFLFGYLGAAVVLIGQVKLLNKTGINPVHKKLFPNSGAKYVMLSVAVIGILAASFAWALPGINSGLFRNISPDDTPVLSSFNGYFENFFATVPRKQAQITAEEQEQFTFETPYERYGDDLHFIVKADSPQYWKTWVYDVYKSSGWENSPIEIEPSTSGSLNPAPASPYGRPEMTYDVEVQLRTDLVLTAGEYLSSNVPASLHRLDYPGTVTPQQQTFMETDTTLSAVTPYTMVPGQSYTVTSAVTNATPAELASAGQDYPPWITDIFLQLPDTLPNAIRDYADNITSNASNPYDKALAIVDSLSGFTYRRNSKVLPEGDDAVDYFLFDKQSGACGDFASSMAILLRAEGIPSRLCTGYRLGELDQETGDYVIRVSNRHAWAEAYFPGYGWIQFEATPGEGRTLGVVGVESIQSDGSTGVWDPMQDMQAYLIFQNSVAGSTSTTTRPQTPNEPISPSIFLIWPVVIVAAGIVIAIVIYLVYLWRNRSRTPSRSGDTDYATEAYTGLCNLAVQAGFAPKPSQTPSEFGAALIAEFPHVGDYIDIILKAFINQRYGYIPSTDENLRWNLVKARRHVFDAIRDRIEGKD